MRYISTCLLILSYCLNISHVQAQDSLSFFQKEKIKASMKKDFIKNYYINPANKVHYSSLSYSDLFAQLESQKADLYQKQEGNKIEGMGIYTHSFQKLDSITSIWGKASYVNQRQGDIQWNNSLDFDKIRPYVMADSTAATTKFQSYAFEGGYAKELNKWSLGASLAYQANMGYRTRDPRPKSVSSDISLKLGLGYVVYKNWSIDTYALLSKYTQNTSVKFANEASQAALYQMQGLGTWNNYFSNKSSKVAFEELGYEAGINIAQNKAKNFTVGASYGQYNLDKLIFSNIGTNEGGDDINKLKKEQLKIYALKTFQWNQHQWGVKWQTNITNHKGTEILYSNNDKYLVRLMEKENYKFEDNSHTIEGFYSYTALQYTLSVNPYFKSKKIVEQLKETGVAQKFKYQFLGITLDYYQKLNANSAFKFTPTLTYRNVSNSTNMLQTETRKESIQEWLTQDYKYNSTNYIHWETSATYQFEPLNFPTLYITLNFNTIQFKTKEKNQNINLTIGVTF